MRLCVFSDVHGNGPAFRAAYPKILAEGADVNIFLGDLCGYYYDQMEIFSKLRKMPNLIAIMGNHDRMFLDILNGGTNLLEVYRQKYGRSMDHLLVQKHGELADWLSSLPKSYEAPGNIFRCFHGSPENSLEGYIYPDSPLDFCRDLSDVLFLGHTHYKMYRSVGDGLIINPGSLGQPRDGGWPSYAVINYPSEKVIFREVFYDKSELVRRIDKLDVNSQYLREVLFR